MFYSLKIQEFNIKFSNQYGLFITNLIQFIDINAYVFFHAVGKNSILSCKGCISSVHEYSQSDSVIKAKNCSYLYSNCRS